MELNKNHNLILKDIYVYDIEACHYTILNNLGFDLCHINPENKLERNIKIGLMMKNNPRITSLLRTTTNSIIDDYIVKNNISPEDVIIRQYDGMTLKRKIHYTNNGNIPLELRRCFKIFISSFDRKKYIAMDNWGTDITVKGVSYYYEALNEIYRKLINISELNKGSIFSRLQNLKDSFFKEDNPIIFGIPKDKVFVIFLKEYGQVEVSQSTLKILDTDDIDKLKYWEMYIKPFTQSIVYENLKERK